MDWTTTFVDALARLTPATLLALLVLGVLWAMVKGLLPALRAQAEAQATSNQQLLLIRQSYGELIERAEVIYKRELAELKADLEEEIGRREGLEVRVATLGAEAAALKQELAEKSAALEKAQAEIVELKGQLAAVEADRQKTAQERDVAEKRVSELEAEVGRLNARVEQLRTELDQEREANGEDREAKAA